MGQGPAKTPDTGSVPVAHGRRQAGGQDMGAQSGSEADVSNFSCTSCWTVLSKRGFTF